MSKKGLGKIALGATVGAGLALLFAPKKGSDLRRDIKKKIDDIIKDVDQMKVEDIKKEFKDKVEEVTNGIEDLNIKAYHILTKLFLKDFTKRNYGRILNVASMAGLMPGPYMATYYATKNYIVSLSLAIYEELRKDNSNVKISIFCPGPVDTNFNNVADVKFNISSLTSDYASKIAIDGMFKNKLIIVPPNMKLNRFLIKIAPSKLIIDINSQIQEKRKSKEEN